MGGGDGKSPCTPPLFKIVGIARHPLHARHIHLFLGEQRLLVAGLLTFTHPFGSCLRCLNVSYTLQSPFSVHGGLSRLSKLSKLAELPAKASRASFGVCGTKLLLQDLKTCLLPCLSTVGNYGRRIISLLPPSSVPLLRAAGNRLDLSIIGQCKTSTCSELPISFHCSSC